MQKNHFLQGLFFLIFAQIMVSFNIVVSKYLLTSMPVLLMITLRFLLAAVILLPLHWLTKDSKIKLKNHLKTLTKRDWVFLLAQAITAGALFNCLMLYGLKYTDANVAGIITSALPAIIALMSFVILKEEFNLKKLICVLFTCVGLVIIALEKFKHAAHQSLFGNLIIVLALIPESSYYILVKLHSNRLPVFFASSLINAINALIVLPLAIFFSSTNPLLLTSFDWQILFLLGLSSGLFYVFWYFGCQHVDGTMSSLSTAVMPLATVVLAFIILGEQLSLSQALGMGLIILSIAIYARKG